MENPVSFQEIILYNEPRKSQFFEGVNQWEENPQKKIKPSIRKAGKL